MTLEEDISSPAPGGKGTDTGSVRAPETHAAPTDISAPEIETERTPADALYNDDSLSTNADSDASADTPPEPSPGSPEGRTDPSCASTALVHQPRTARPDSTPTTLDSRQDSRALGGGSVLFRLGSALWNAVPRSALERLPLTTAVSTGIEWVCGDDYEAQRRAADRWWWVDMGLGVLKDVLGSRGEDGLRAPAGSGDEILRGRVSNGGDSHRSKDEMTVRESTDDDGEGVERRVEAADNESGGENDIASESKSQRSDQQSSAAVIDKDAHAEAETPVASASDQSRLQPLVPSSGHNSKTALTDKTVFSELMADLKSRTGDLALLAGGYAVNCALSSAAQRVMRCVSASADGDRTCSPAEEMRVGGVVACASASVVDGAARCLGSGMGMGMGWA